MLNKWNKTLKAEDSLLMFIEDWKTEDSYV